MLGVDKDHFLCQASFISKGLEAPRQESVIGEGAGPSVCRTETFICT
jgi:hypothetical protein